MSRSLTIEVPDEVVEAIQYVASRTGQRAEDIELEWLDRSTSRPRPVLSDSERRAAWDRLRGHFGAVDSGIPDSADNEAIDRDLTREYGA